MIFLASLGVAWWLVRRRLGLEASGEALALSLALSLLLVLTFSNMSLRQGGWPFVAPFMAMALLVLSLACLRPPAPPLASAGPLPRAVQILAGVAFLVALLLQALRVDDDYWIHSPLQGLLLMGDFPPRNFFYEDVPLGGHYGRDLLVALWARSTGLTVFTSQYLLTAALQPLQLVLLYWALRRVFSTPAALGGTFMAAVGVQCSGRCGLLVILQNNNSVLHTWWALSLYAFSVTWLTRRAPWAGLLGLVLGSLAIVYETHFGLACLASLGTFCLGLSLPGRLQWLRLGSLVLAIASCLAFTQGGPLTELWQRRAHNGNESPGIGRSTQSQHVVLKFPKSRLGQIRCKPAPNQWVEKLSPEVWLFRTHQMSDPGLGYAPFWDPAVLELHSLPLYLSPVLGILALRRRQPLLLWLVLFGMGAFWVPALVDFGPVFEAEYMRWEFAAGLALAVSTGIVLGPWLALGLGQPRAWIALLLLLAQSRDFFFNLQQIYREWNEARRSGRPTWYWGAQDWLTHHPVLDFADADWKLSESLRPQVRLGERLLLHPVARTHQVSYESTLSGLTGLMASRRVPLDTDAVGLVPARQRADVACFFASGDPQYLELHPADWALVRAPERPPLHPKLSWQPQGPHWLARLQVPRHPWPLKWASPLPGLSVQMKGLPAECDEGEVLPLEVELQPAPPTQGRLLLTPRPGDPDDLQPIPVGRGFCAAPYLPGDYRWETLWWDSEGLHPIPGSASLRVGLQSRLLSTRIQSVDIQPSGSRDGWCRLKIQLRTPLRHGRGYAASAEFLPVQAGEEDQPSFHALERLQLVDLLPTAPGVWECSLASLLPPDVGNFRLNVFLSPFDGTTIRVRGPEVQITARHFGH